MAENNSKKPMALLLLVVVGVLVVLYFAGGDSDCNVVTPGACSDGVSVEADCTGDNTWTAETTVAKEADDKVACEADGGVWSGSKEEEKEEEVVETPEIPVVTP